MKKLTSIIVTALMVISGVALISSCNKTGDYWFMIGMEYNTKYPEKLSQYDKIFQEYYDLKDSELKFADISEREATEAATAIFDNMLIEMDQVQVSWDKGEYYKVTLVMDYPKLKFVKDKIYPFQ